MGEHHQQPLKGQKMHLTEPEINAITKRANDPQTGLAAWFRAVEARAREIANSRIRLVEAERNCQSAASDLVCCLAEASWDEAATHIENVRRALANRAARGNEAEHLVTSVNEILAPLADASNAATALLPLLSAVRREIPDLPIETQRRLLKAIPAVDFRA